MTTARPACGWALVTMERPALEAVGRRVDRDAIEDAVEETSLDRLRRRVRDAEDALAAGSLRDGHRPVAGRRREQVLGAEAAAPHQLVQPEPDGTLGRTRAAPREDVVVDGRAIAGVAAGRR